MRVEETMKRLLTGTTLQMHLGYHELRNMLKTFREEREKKKQGGVSGGTGSAGGATTGTSWDHRSSRGDEYRERDRSDRDRGHDRHSSSRYE